MNKQAYVMKHDVVQSIVQMEPSILRQLVTEVKETVATGVNLGGFKESTPSFGIVDMWNVRRNSRHARNYRRKARIVTGIGY
jgi:hypothetical protein